jgi:hypothetical protein
MTHTLSKDEYYGVVLKDSKFHTPTTDITKTPQLALDIYAWVNDFSDRRGLRQTWDMVSEADQDKFMNDAYALLQKNLNGSNVVTIKEIDKLIELFLTIPSMSNEYDNIDQDIQDEIRGQWLSIFQKGM